MNEGSRFYDLRSGRENVWSSPRLELPERLTTPSGESLERVNLPNASLCADFLATSDGVWAGVAIAMTIGDIDAIWKMFEKCSPKRVRMIRPEQARAMDRYRCYGEFGWLEVMWLETAHPELIEVQTNEVLWYALRHQSEVDPKIVLLGLENLPNLLNEPERPLIAP